MFGKLGTIYEELGNSAFSRYNIGVVEEKQQIMKSDGMAKLVVDIGGCLVDWVLNMICYGREDTNIENNNNTNDFIHYGFASIYYNGYNLERSTDLYGYLKNEMKSDGMYQDYVGWVSDNKCELIITPYVQAEKYINGLMETKKKTKFGSDENKDNDDQIQIVNKDQLQKPILN
eukprot:550700_1